MRHRLVGALLALLIAAPLWAATITLPATVTGEPGAFISIPATTDGKEVRWYALDKGVNLFPTALLKDTKTAVVTAPKAGRYRVIAWTATGDVPSEAASTVVVVGEPGPDPGPGPGPTPGPDSPLKKAIDAAFAAETDPAKAAQIKYLASVYAGAGTLVDDPSVKMLSDLFALVSNTIHHPTLGIPRGALPKVSRAIGDYLNAEIGTVAAVAPDKAKVKAAFASVATALGGYR